MVTINLSTAPQQEQLIRRKKLLDKGLLVSLALIVAVGIAHGLIVYYGNIVQKKLSTLQQQVIGESDKLVGEDVDRIVDLHARIKFISEHFDKRYNPIRDLQHAENMIVPGVYLDVYSIDVLKNELSITGVAHNFQQIVRQIVSLKNSGLFSDVTVEGTDRDENVINFRIKLQFND